MLVVSPHADDAALGIGARLMGAVAGRSQVVTVFDGSPDLYPPLMIRPHDETCGFAEGDDVMASRRAEDDEAARYGGWDPFHVGLIDVAYLERRPRPAGQAETFWRVLAEAWTDAGKPREVWCPAAVNHPDHRWVRDQTTVFAQARGLEVWVWMEPGYRSHYRDECAAIDSMLQGSHAELVPWKAAERKLSLICCYRSQLNGIAALAVTDALQSEEWGRWL